MAVGQKSKWRVAHPVTWWQMRHPGEDTPDVARLEAWRAENPAAVDLAYAKSAHKKRSGKGEGTLTLKEWKRAVEHFGGCAYCGEVRKRYQKDHFIPVTEGGRFEAANIVPACERCNKRKHSKRPEVFLEGKLDVLERIMTYLTTYLTNAKL